MWPRVIFLSIFKILIFSPTYKIHSWRVYLSSSSSIFVEVYSRFKSPSLRLKASKATASQFGKACSISERYLNINATYSRNFSILFYFWPALRSVNIASKCNTNIVRCKNERKIRGYLLCIASDFLLNLSGLKDALSFLKNRNEGQCVTLLPEYDQTSSLLAGCCTHLDDHYLNRNMVWQSDWCSEVLRQCHQQVQDGNDTLSMNH